MLFNISNFTRKLVNKVNYKFYFKCDWKSEILFWKSERFFYKKELFTGLLRTQIKQSFKWVDKNMFNVNVIHITVSV